MKIGKYIPKRIKRIILFIVRIPEKISVKIYKAASVGKIPFPDKAFQKWDYKIHTGHRLNLRNPVTFQEKLQWLKYYYRNPELTKLVDKYEVREYVREKIGEEYLVPLYGVYNKWDEIDFDALPDSFVIKCTHDSGSVVICPDKNSLDYESAKAKIEAGLLRNQFYLSREWPYKNVKPRIIIEKYLVDDATGDLPDYKFFCFGGKPKYVQICSERFFESGLKENNYDMNWNELPFNEIGITKNNNITEKSVWFSKMESFAEKLSEYFPHVRVDFIVTKNLFFFTELTFFDGGGRHLYVPDEYNKIIGEYITLPEKMR